MIHRARNRKERKAARRRQRFSLSIHPLDSLIAVGLGVLSLAGLITAFVLSGAEGGLGGMYLGGIGFGCLLVSIAGTILAGKSFQKPDIHYTFPITGLVLNILLIMGCLVLYIVGMVM